MSHSNDIKKPKFSVYILIYLFLFLSLNFRQCTNRNSSVFYFSRLVGVDYRTRTFGNSV